MKFFIMQIPVFSSYLNLVLHLTEDDDIGGAGHVVSVGGIKITVCWKTSRKRPDHLRNLDVDERILLKCYLEKYSMRVQLIQDRGCYGIL